MLTINGAKLLRHDDRTGSLEPGKYADFVVIDKNLFEIPISEIGSAKIMLTILEGQVVYNGTMAPANCGLFGLNLFCPRRGKCGFFRRLFNINGCS